MGQARLEGASGQAHLCASVAHGTGRSSHWKEKGGTLSSDGVLLIPSTFWGSSSWCSQLQPPGGILVLGFLFFCS